MTPIVVEYGLTPKGHLFEISKGNSPWINGKIMYGLTVKDKQSFESLPISGPCENYEDAKAKAGRS